MTPSATTDEPRFPLASAGAIWVPWRQRRARPAGSRVGVSLSSHSETRVFAGSWAMPSRAASAGGIRIHRYRWSRAGPLQYHAVAEGFERASARPIPAPGCPGGTSDWGRWLPRSALHALVCPRLTQGATIGSRDRNRRACRSGIASPITRWFHSRARHRSQHAGQSSRHSRLLTASSGYPSTP